MKILVTGATGFIGKHLVAELLKEGRDVVCLVRETSNVDFLKNTKAALVYSDITEREHLDKIFRQVSPGVVFHCAAVVMEQDEEKLHRANIEGTRNICMCCFKYGIKRLIYLSSVAVVSGNTEVPITDDLPYRFTAPYGRSKIEAERIVLENREKGMDVVVIRPCIVYGEDERHFQDRLFKWIERRLVLIPDLPGMDSLLKLVYVGNVVQILMLALYKDEALQGTFIVADKETITIRKFVKIVYEKMGKGSPPVVPAWAAKALMILPPVRNMANKIFKDRVFDISRARKLLGYEPEVSTAEGLTRTVEYWRKNIRYDGKCSGLNNRLCDCKIKD